MNEKSNLLLVSVLFNTFLHLGCSVPGLEDLGEQSTKSVDDTEILEDSDVIEEDECIADVNGDGKVDAYDKDELALYWGECPEGMEECPWDLDGDGDVDIRDNLILLADYGPCEEDTASD